MLTTADKDHLKIAYNPTYLIIATILIIQKHHNELTF